MYPARNWRPRFEPSVAWLTDRRGATSGSQRLAGANTTSPFHGTTPCASARSRQSWPILQTTSGSNDRNWCVGSGCNLICRPAPDGRRRSAHHGGAANPVSFVWDGDDLLNEYRSGGVSCRYDVLDGEVFGEKRGADRYLYVPDPLGSINHLLNTSQNTAGTTVYYPYGDVQSHTGPGRGDALAGRIESNPSDQGSPVLVGEFRLR